MDSASRARRLIRALGARLHMNLKRAKVLAIYLMVIGFLQICLYLAMSKASDEYSWLIYLDPRIGLFFLESSARGTEQSAPSVLRWLLAA